ncbi:MAG: UDP-2,3-diacylglucosamine diphosphatase LpxI [Alphaproteobacteria bacterium]|nr:UDP-2,3-diacylglucosamine diphosphatase LpxI [Alphaproteobacteria bacterium]
MPKLGIIAGGGEVPRQLIEACRKLGRAFFVVCLEGQADPDLAKDDPHVWLPLGAGARLKEIFAGEAIAEVIMIGRVRRPSLLEIKPDWFTLKVLTKIGMNSLGDDGLLSAIGKVFEEEGGVRVVGVQDVFAGLLTPAGVLTRAQPDEDANNDIRRGVEAARALGRVDVGQSVIVQQGIVLGVEAIEGTDALIARCAGLRRDGPGGVLVKFAKPQQDNRFDLPTIGPDTVASAAKAGLRGIAIESGRSLIVERESAVAAADEAGLFIAGINPNVSGHD